MAISSILLSKAGRLANVSAVAASGKVGKAAEPLCEVADAA